MPTSGHPDRNATIRQDDVEIQPNTLHPVVADGVYDTAVLAD